MCYCLDSVEGCKSIAAGVNAMDLRSGINMAVDDVVSNLKSKAVMISNLKSKAVMLSAPEEITQVISRRNLLVNSGQWLFGSIRSR